ncbi:MAG TPA: IPT/TIG domain-containing protein, partial [Candidatus Krumholzibacterium sp.]|nr:IPT/TIG domain-containing protein [Candidatus Krumholzibacterium sp.]
MPLLILGMLSFFTCSQNPTGPQDRQEIAFSPSSGSPGTLITLTGVDLAGIDADSLSVAIGSEPAPAVVVADGRIVTGIPLFLDISGASSPPTEPVDLVLQNGSEVLFSAQGALTVTPLVDAPGSTVSLADRLGRIGESLGIICATLASTPGAQAQYSEALSAALDSLLTGDGDASFATNLVALQSDAVALRVVDAVLAHSGLLDAMSSYAELFESLADELQPASPLTGEAAATSIDESDVSLAKQMQFYVILRDFGQDVIAESTAQIGAVAGLIGIASSNPYVATVALITNYVDFIVNKIAIGLFPSDLDAVDVSVDDPMLDHGATTSSTITLTASNTPPGISVLDLTNQVLVGLGLAASPGEATFRTILERTSQYFLGL